MGAVCTHGKVTNLAEDRLQTEGREHGNYLEEQTPRFSPRQKVWNDRSENFTPALDTTDPNHVESTEKAGFQIADTGSVNVVDVDALAASHLPHGNVDHGPQCSPGDAAGQWAVADFMTFTIVGARGFRNSDWMPGRGKPDCHVVVKSKQKKIFKTKAITHSMEPLWNDEFEFRRWEDGAELEFHLYDQDLVGSDYLGKAMIQSDSFQDGFNGDLRLDQPGKDKGNEQQPAYLRIKIKPPGKVYPPGPSPELCVTLSRNEHKNFGLQINTQDQKNLYIQLVFESGPASEWNQHAEPHNHLSRGDFIVEVNGVEGNASAMLEKFREQVVVMKVRRAIDFIIILERSQVKNASGNMQDFGIQFAKNPSGQGLVVLGVETSGLIADWNASTSDPASRVQVGDRILRVGNREAGSALQLVKALREVSGKFQLHLVRTAPVKEEGSSHWRFK
mmetsp:Transcript_12422/g.24146  ORF Transcript_12422/g.24146 Transcript_12422/m.24146 type:complete len:447 (-) Transcript_12422:134-1474(-)|eukprot:CAMPEP_0172723600 /NCGR_PEP_ID=MMETSP1074-20121228/84082_1 /TAXON_ID=2916 /ORGANISM="Ceratium fusus, Strain PA161109" /LENGTH=446 /DNA_ID=CAMNT_0013549873 /DNA_START=26 /DNA_END=1366 /DNA_ORIENTATION=-